MFRPRKQYILTEDNHSPDWGCLLLAITGLGMSFVAGIVSAIVLVVIYTALAPSNTATIKTIPSPIVAIVPTQTPIYLYWTVTPNTNQPVAIDLATSTSVPPTATAIPTGTPLPTHTPIPSATVTPEPTATFTLEPTATQVPSVTPTVAPAPISSSGPTYSEICDVNTSNMTDPQIATHTEKFKGQRFENWQGWVYDVSGYGEKFDLQIAMKPRGLFWSRNIVIEDIPLDLAFRLNVEQPLTFSGRIANVDTFFDSICNPIYVDDYTIIE